MLEICCSSFEDAISAAAGGANRVELCSGFAVGGLTPSQALTKSVTAAVSLPVRVLIRPREGHFVWDRREKALILAEALGALDSGAEGVVIGGLDAEGHLDEQLLESVLRRVSGEQITFHRAFDEASDLSAAYQRLSELGIDCVLTSGGASTAIEGLQQIKALVEAGGTTQIMAGGGVRPQNVAQLLSVGVHCVHFSARQPTSAPFTPRLFTDPVTAVDAELVAQMQGVMLEGAE